MRNKAISLLSIIEKIGKRDSKSIQKLMIELDIQLDENGNISKEDIVRLISPTIYNIGILNEKLTAANDLSTYLTFKRSLHYLNLNGLTEEEIYPTELLQLKDLAYDYVKGNVPLSNNQRKELEQKSGNITERCTKFLLEI